MSPGTRRWTGSLLGAGRTQAVRAQRIAASLSFSGALNQADLVKLRLDDFDRQVVMSPMTNAADLFQTLEIVFRRMAEQAAAEPETV